MEDMEKIVVSSGEEYIDYAISFEKNLTLLEAQLHSVEDPEEIAKNTLIAAVEFYDGDWCGIIEGDLVMEAWCPVLWYNRIKKGMTETRFKELEDTSALERWVDALYQCKPIIIPDTTVYKETNPAEYDIYRRLNAESILAVPFWKNPIGFLIVRNPKRYINQSSFLQMLAFVVFSSVTEKKLIDRASKAFSPENIKKDTDIIINLFGSLEIYTSKGVLTEEEISSPKICRFLVYLLLHRERPIPPRLICEAVWPNEETDNSGNKIKALAFRLQSAFGIISDYRLVVSTPQGYQLNPELKIMTDFETFEELWIQAQNAVTLQTKIELLKKVIELYKGDIFESANAEHWIMPHEIAYKYKCLGVYAELMRIYYESGNYMTTQYYAAMALKIDPANVDAYYWMIRAMKQKDASGMLKGELKMAEHVLSEGEYEELLVRLEKVKE